MAGDMAPGVLGDAIPSCGTDGVGLHLQSCLAIADEELLDALDKAVERYGGGRPAATRAYAEFAPPEQRAGGGNRSRKRACCSKPSRQRATAALRWRRFLALWKGR